MGTGGKRNIDVVVAGHICLDITPVFRVDDNTDICRIFTPGNLTNMQGVYVSAAGAVPNVGICLNILGLETKLMGKIGNDLFGEGIFNHLKEKGLDGNIVMIFGETTSYTIVLAPPGIDRMFLHHTGTNDTFTADDIDYDLIKKTRLFHFGYPPLMKKMYENDGEELVQIFRRVKESGAITSLDMAFIEPSSSSGKANWEKILRNVLPYVDIYIPSIEETLYMVKRDYYNELNRKNLDIIKSLDINVVQELGERLTSYGANILAIKCGVKGYYVRTRQKEHLKELRSRTCFDLENWSGRELLAETYDVSGIKSTTGAGDSSIAGFLAGFLNGNTIEETVKIANAIATQSIKAYDVFSGVKNFRSTLEMVKKGMPVIHQQIGRNYWKYDKSMGLWKGKNDQ